MAILTVEISDELQQNLDRAAASGRFKDRSTLVQMLLETAIGLQWKEDAEQRIDEALDEVERGHVAPWNKGDCARIGRAYLQEKHTHH